MIETWVLIIWLGNCVGSDCPIESWVATEKENKYLCEADLSVWNSISDNHKGVCVFGVLTDLEPE